MFLICSYVNREMRPNASGTRRMDPLVNITAANASRGDLRRCAGSAAPDWGNSRWISKRNRFKGGAAGGQVSTGDARFLRRIHMGSTDIPVPQRAKRSSDSPHGSSFPEA